MVTTRLTVFVALDVLGYGVSATVRWPWASMLEVGIQSCSFKASPSLCMSLGFNVACPKGGISYFQIMAAVCDLLRNTRSSLPSLSERCVTS